MPSQVTITNTGTFDVIAGNIPGKPFNIQPIPPTGLVTDGLRIHHDYSNPSSWTPNAFNTINDLSGYNIWATATTTGSQFNFSGSDYNGSFVFNPTSDPGNAQSVIDISNSVNAPYYTSNPTVTLDFWLKISPSGITIFGSNNATGAGRLTVQAVPTSATAGYFRVNKGAFGINTADFSGSYTYSMDVPLNLTVTKTGFVYQLYVNGEFKASKTDGTSTTYNIGNHALGQNWNPGAPTGQKAVEKFRGSMYTFMAYNKVLSSAEILQNFNYRRARFGL